MLDVNERLSVHYIHIKLRTASVLRKLVNQWFDVNERLCNFIKQCLISRAKNLPEKESIQGPICQTRISQDKNYKNLKRNYKRESMFDVTRKIVDYQKKEWQCKYMTNKDCLRFSSKIWQTCYPGWWNSTLLINISLPLSADLLTQRRRQNI